MTVKAVIITAHSKCIYVKSDTGEFDASSDIAGSFLSAINTFALKISDENLRVIKLGKLQIVYELLDEKTHLYLAVFTDPGEYVHDLILQIKKAFLETFTIKEIDQHVSEPDFFRPFDNALKRILWD